MNINLSRIELYQGDITTLEVNAVVNAANSTLLGGGGVDGAIHAAAGPLLLEECRTLNGCETGEAKLSGGYNLKADHVIHTVGPIYAGRRRDAEMLAGCYRNSLRLAHENGLETIAFPAISTGVYRYPKDEACAIAINTVLGALDIFSGVKKVIFVLYSEEDYALYKRYIEKISKR